MENRKENLMIKEAATNMIAANPKENLLSTNTNLFLIGNNLESESETYKNIAAKEIKTVNRSIEFALSISSSNDFCWDIFFFLGIWEIN